MTFYWLLFSQTFINVYDIYHILPLMLPHPPFSRPCLPTAAFFLSRLYYFHIYVIYRYDFIFVSIWKKYLSFWKLLIWLPTVHIYPAKNTKSWKKTCHCACIPNLFLYFCIGYLCLFYYLATVHNAVINTHPMMCWLGVLWRNAQE